MKMNRICAALLTATMMVMPLAGCQSHRVHQSLQHLRLQVQASVQESVLASDASSSGAVTGTADRTRL